MSDNDRFEKFAADFFKERPITVDTIRTFKAVVCRRVKAPSSVVRYFAAAKPWLAMKRLEGAHNIDREGVNLILKAPRIPKKIPESLLPDEVRALLKAATEFRVKDYAWYVLLALTTGARPGEVVSVQGSHFSAPKGTLRIFAPKTATAREVPLKWSTSLTKLAGANLHQGLLMHLTSNRGLPETRYWRELLALAELPVYEPRILRSTVGTCIASSGHLTGLEYVKWMGHSLKVAVDFYIDPEGKRADGNTIEAWLGAEAEYKALAARCLEAA